MRDGRKRLRLLGALAKFAGAVVRSSSDLPRAGRALRDVVEREVGSGNLMERDPAETRAQIFADERRRRMR